MVVKDRIHIGDYWGRKYDYARYYLPFRIQTGIKYYNHNRYQCLETIRERMYEVDGFIPQRGSVVYDIGANVGDYSLIWAKVYGAQVVAFEPLIENTMELILNQMLNMDHRIKTITSGLSDIDQFEHVQYDGNMLSIDNPGGRQAEISFARLDTIVKRLDLPKPDIIKIDVEGYEMKVLNGGATTIEAYCPKIIIETHSSDLRKQVQEFLEHMGYDLAYADRARKGKGWMDEVTNLFFSPGRVK